MDQQQVEETQQVSKQNKPKTEKLCTGVKGLPGCGKFFIPESPNSHTCAECRQKYIDQHEAAEQKKAQRREQIRVAVRKHRDRLTDFLRLPYPEMFFDVLIDCAEYSRFRLGQEGKSTPTMHDGIGSSSAFYGRRGDEADRYFNERFLELESYLMDGGKLVHTKTCHTQWVPGQGTDKPAVCWFCAFFDSSRALALARRFQRDILHEKSAQQLKTEFEAKYGSEAA